MTPAHLGACNPKIDMLLLAINDVPQALLQVNTPTTSPTDNLMHFAVAKWVPEPPLPPAWLRSHMATASLLQFLRQSLTQLRTCRIFPFLPLRPAMIIDRPLDLLLHLLAPHMLLRSHSMPAHAAPFRVHPCTRGYCQVLVPVK